MCKNIYRFRLGEFFTLTEVNPYYDANLDKEFNIEPNQKFFRETLTGKLTFVGADFHLVNDKPFAHQYRIQIDKLLEDGSYQDEWFVGEFTKTDFSLVDLDQEIIEVTPKPKDKYKNIVDSLDKEFDLIELSPDVSQVKIALQPLIQIYTALSGVVTNILSGIQFETPVSTPTLNFTQLTNDFKFELNKTLVFVPGEASLLTPDVSGEYQENIYASNDNQFQLVTIGFADVAFPLQTDDPDGLAESNFVVPASTLTDEDFLSIWSTGGKNFEYIGTQMISGVPNLGFRGLDGDTAAATGTLTHVSGATNTADLIYTNYDNTFVVQRWGMFHAVPPSGPSQYLFLAPMQEGLAFQNDGFSTFKRSALFSPINGSTGSFKVFVETLYTRVLTNAASFDGNATFDIPEEDIISSHGRYSKVVGLDYLGYQLADDNQLTSDKYGRFSEDAANYADQYFIKPTVVTTGQMIPLQLSEWSEASLWILYTPTLQALQASGNEIYTLNHAYRLSSVVKSFLREIDPSLTHEEDVDHSEFFYSVNAIRSILTVPLISPKSNLISGNYDKPARKAKIRFADITNLLRDFYQVYFYITSDNKFKLEAVDFFDRGLTYTGQNINTDLTTLLEAKTKKAWSYKDRKFTYLKTELPELIKHSWMDSVSQPFEGTSIKMLSPYVDKGNFDERSMSRFTSDVDYIHAQSGSISTDGFAFFEAVLVDNELELPFLALTVDSDDYTLQNGYASMFFAHLKYWLFDLPANDVNLNYEDKTATTIKKTKIQEIEYPSTEDLDPLKLLISSLGTGSISKMTINLSTGSVKINLKHVTE